MFHVLRRLAPRARAVVSITRQGALAVASTQPVTMAITPARRAFTLLGGSVLIGIGVASFSRAEFGLPPYDMMLSAISAHVDVSLGQAAWIAAAVLYLLATALGRRPAPAALVFTFINGLSVDATLNLTDSPSSMAVRVVLVAVGVWAIAGGIALVVHSHSTGGPFELLMAIGSDHGMRPSTVRTGLEATVFVAGVATGGVFGWATIVFALSIGPVLGIVLQGLTDHRVGRTVRLSSDRIEQLV